MRSDRIAEDDALAAARGLILAVALSIPLWALILWPFFRWLR